MKITERLVLFMQYEGLTVYQMNRMASLPPSLLKKTIDLDRGLTSSTIEKLVKAFPNLNADWLVTGRGNMLISDESPSLNKTKALTKDLESSLYRQISWHLLLQDSYADSHDRLVEIIEMLKKIEDNASSLIDQLSRIRQLIEQQYALQAQDHGLYEMTLRIAAGEDGKYTPCQLKEKREIETRIMKILSRK